MNEKTTIKDAIIFSSKATISAIAAMLCAGTFHLPSLVWAPMSAVLVTQPKLHPSYRAAASRVSATLLGAITGAAASAFIGHNITAMALGILVVGLFCHLGRLDDATRLAYAEVVLVSMGKEPEKWTFSLDRVTGAVIGCGCALLIGVLFDFISRKFSPVPRNHASQSDSTE